MNFREHFEAWHKATYGFVGKCVGTAIAAHYQTSTTQARWEGWQACANWHVGQQLQAEMSKDKKETQT